MNSWVLEQTGKFINYTSVNEVLQSHFSLLAVSAKWSRSSEKPLDPEIELLNHLPRGNHPKESKKRQKKRSLWRLRTAFLEQKTI